MTTVLLLAAAEAPDLATDLAGVGFALLGRTDAPALVRDVARLQPQLLVCWEPYPAAALLPALQALRRHAPLPVLLFTRDAEVQTLEAALEAGVDAWVVNGYAPARLRPLAQLAQARFARDAAGRRELEDLRARFEERKLVDRAKGLLMRSHGIDEDEAFRLLRAASMQEHERVGRVSQRVIDAARDAESINRAGQLRMLSQRLVALQALRCAADADEPAARARQDAAARRAADNLKALGGLLSAATYGDVLDPVVAGWQALAGALRGPASAAGLGAIDVLAEQWLEAAERLTAALEAVSPLPRLAIVNLAGRQRMLSQRLAKQALLAALGDAALAQRATADALQTMATFEAALARLRQAPLDSPAIRTPLAEAQQQWARLRAAVAGGAGGGPVEIAAAAEDLLAVFERLTEAYAAGVQQLFEPG